MEIIVLIGIILLFYHLYNSVYKKKCPSCGKKVPKEAISCHYCSFTFVKPREGQTKDDVIREQIEIQKISRRRRRAAWFIIIVGIIIFIMVAG